MGLETTYPEAKLKRTAGWSYSVLALPEWQEKPIIKQWEPSRFRGKHGAGGIVAVYLGVFSVSSVYFLCFHFLSWNKNGMETLPDP